MPPQGPCDVRRNSRKQCSELHRGGKSTFPEMTEEAWQRHQDQEHSLNDAIENAKGTAKHGFEHKKLKSVQSGVKQYWRGDRDGRPGPSNALRGFFGSRTWGRGRHVHRVKVALNAIFVVLTVVPHVEICTSWRVDCSVSPPAKLTEEPGAGKGAALVRALRSVGAPELREYPRRAPVAGGWEESQVLGLNSRVWRLWSSLTGICADLKA